MISIALLLSTFMKKMGPTTQEQIWMGMVMLGIRKEQFNQHRDLDSINVRNRREVRIVLSMQDVATLPQVEFMVKHCREVMDKIVADAGLPYYYRFPQGRRYHVPKLESRGFCMLEERYRAYILLVRKIRAQEDPVTDCPNDWTCPICLDINQDKLV